MRSLRILMSSVLCLLSVPSVQALTYAAEMDLNTWRVDSSPFVCRLKQQIPGFGEAAFEREGGVGQIFYLKSHFSPLKPGSAQLVVRKPVWGGGRPEVNLGYVAIASSSRPITLSGSLVDRLQTELYMGMSPTFSRTSITGVNEVVSVALSGISFRKALPEYQRCFSQLFPYNFRQLSSSEVVFEKETVELTEAAKKRLRRIVDYIKTSPETITLKVEGYADKSGRSIDKMQLAQKRAVVVADYLLEQGVKGEVISIVGHSDSTSAAKHSKALIKLHK